MFAIKCRNLTIAIKELKYGRKYAINKAVRQQSKIFPQFTIDDESNDVNETTRTREQRIHNTKMHIHIVHIYLGTKYI